MKIKNFYVAIFGFILSFLAVGKMIYQGETTQNQDQKGYQSIYQEIDAQSIRKIKGEKMVIGNSTLCPKFRLNDDLIKDSITIARNRQQGIFFVFDDVRSKFSDQEIKKYADEMGINAKDIYVISKNTYPINGGLLNADRRYNEFISDLEKKEIKAGYPYFIQLENENVIYSGYPLSN